MPELPDVSLYVQRIDERVKGQPLLAMTVFNPFILRSVDPKPSEFIGQRVERVRRLGKRIVLSLERDLHIVIHLMIAGRFTWQSPTPEGPFKPAKLHLAAWTWPNGRLMLVESSTKKRASVYLAQGERALAPHAREGLDVITATREEFSEKLQGQSRTLKRALTDPSSFDGIGNAYSDEILFAARLSPTRMTSNLSLEETDRLFKATRETLTAWTRQLSIQYPDFPKPAQITAFRKEFNVHGRFKEPCRVCGAPIQRIVFSENETNYCAQCQNGGKLLADRSLSRLLK